MIKSGTILMIKGHPQGQNVYVKVKYAKIWFSRSNMIFLTNSPRNKCNTSFLCTFDLENPFMVLFSWFHVIFKIKTSISRSNEPKFDSNKYK